MSTEHPLPMNRIYLLNPSQSLDAGDRRLTGFRPPLFDNPATVDSPWVHAVDPAKFATSFGPLHDFGPPPSSAPTFRRSPATARPVHHPARRAPGRPVHRPGRQAALEAMLHQFQPA
jgi:hypothetical protein